MMLHDCAAPGCGKRIRTTLLMCPHHWFKVPTATRKDVHDAWAKFRDGTATIEGLRAVQAKAITAVTPASTPKTEPTPRPADETIRGITLAKPRHTVYRGERLTSGVSISVNTSGRQVALTPASSFRLTPVVGFEWGYSGAGPMQLAIALVFDATGDRDLTSRAYEWFMKAVVACLPQEGWQLTAAEIGERLLAWEQEDLHRQHWKQQQRERRERAAAVNAHEGENGGGV